MHLTKGMEKASKHRPVLLEETIEHLNVQAGESYLDCTFGGGGHSKLILERSAPDGRVVGLDRDGNVAEIAAALKAEFPDRFEFHHYSYDELDRLGEKFDGILFDLGLSSDQLELSGRGFSFSKTEPLDMRFDERGGQTAAQFLMQSSPERIEKVFREYAEDRHARGLASKIVQYRRNTPIRTTTDFVRIVGTESPSVLAPLFQALRIEVNDELQTLKNGLQLASSALKIGGRLVVISFHSLEDRIVKEFMKTNLRPMIKKPISPSQEEIAANSRCRSAKLRLAVKEEG